MSERGGEVRNAHGPRQVADRSSASAHRQKRFLKKRAMRCLVVLGVESGRRKLALDLDDLFDTLQKVLLRRDLSAFANGEHARLGADAPELGASCVGAQSSDEFEPDPALDRHGASVNAENVGAAVVVWEREFDASVETPGSEESRVKGVWSVGRHDLRDVGQKSLSQTGKRGDAPL